MGESDRILAKLASLDIRLPGPPAPAGSYMPCLEAHGFLYVSGQLPLIDGVLIHKGKLGRDITVEEGQKAARQTALNALAVAKAGLGSLERIKRVVRLTGYIQAVEGFTEHAQVLNGASDFLFEVFGEEGRHARAAIGANSLPRDTPVEVEYLFAL